jgi:L-fuconolactonase
MPERIDAHHHLWRYQAQEFGWINAQMKILARDFLESELEKEMSRAGLSGAVAVQARQSLQETEWLLSIAESSNLIRGVVGWAPLADESFPQILESFSARSKLKGLRHVIQDEPDIGFIAQEDFNRGIASMAKTSLVYDLLIFPRHLPSAIEFVDRHPEQVFVLDHLAKPPIRDRVLEPWRTQITELARRENVFCKVSGMVTEADWAGWQVQDLRPYLNVVLEAFGPSRLMVGSDWPVCLLASSYQRWFRTLEDFTAQLSANEKELIFGRVASKVYRLQEVNGIAL